MGISTGDILRVAAIMTRAGLTDILANIWHCECEDDNSLTLAELKEDLVELIDEIHGGMDTFMSDNITFDRIELTNITQSEVYEPEDWPTLTVGGEVGENTAEGVCGLTYWRTAKPKRIGRKFWGIMTEAHMEDGIWNASMVTGLNTAADYVINLTAPGNGSTWNFGTWGWVDPEDELLGKEYNEFISAHASAVPAYQRRRKRGVGS